ncbi:hypothetical protein [Caldisphaera lagunensis]|nr:hypothetical protein [Caldisphaera lagunensis]
MEDNTKNIIKEYFNKSFNFIFIDLIIDIFLLLFSLYFVSSYLIKITIYALIIASTVFLITILYYSYNNFKNKIAILKECCNGEISYNKKRNLLTCSYSNNLKICLSLDYDRVYINKIDKYIKDTEDTRDFYCVRFEDGKIERNEEYMKTFQGIFRLIDKDNIALFQGKTIIIDKIDKTRIKYGIERLVNQE